MIALLMGRDERREALATVVLAFGLVAAFAYVAQRVSSHVAGEVDVDMVLRSPVVAFYWRCATSAFWGGVGAAATWMIVRRRAPAEKVARQLGRWVLPLAIALGLLVWWLP